MSDMELSGVFFCVDNRVLLCYGVLVKMIHTVHTIQIIYAMYAERLVTDQLIRMEFIK
ncbi:hypothetical protein C823_003222 [Eubacterium plexicaudatum ASF492]|nr:hypothetical protein C823_003222 [Eubacterium plexicaudatum ASF492]